MGHHDLNAQNSEITFSRGNHPDSQYIKQNNLNTYQTQHQTIKDLKQKQQSWGGYNVDREKSTTTSDIAFTVFLEVTDDISDNVGKISIVALSESD